MKQIIIKRYLKNILFSLLMVVFLTNPMTTKAMAGKFEGQELTVLIWGTTWNYEWKVAAETFEKIHGVKVRPIFQTNAADGLIKLQSMRDRGGKSPVDILFTIRSVAERGSDLFADIPESAIPNKADLVEGAVSKKHVAYRYYPVSIIYRTDLVPKPIKNWEDLWDPVFKGKLAIPSAGFYEAYFLIVTAYLNGGNEKNIDPGFQKVKTLLPNVVTFYSTDGGARKILGQGEAAVIIGPISFLATFLKEKLPVKMVSPKPTPFMFNVMAPVKGGNEALALEFIRFAVTPEAQAESIKFMRQLSINKKVTQDKELEEALPRPGDEIIFDDTTIIKNISSWVERWNREISR